MYSQTFTMPATFGPSGQQDIPLSTHPSSGKSLPRSEGGRKGVTGQDEASYHALSFHLTRRFLTTDYLLAYLSAGTSQLPELEDSRDGKSAQATSDSSGPAAGAPQYTVPVTLYIHIRISMRPRLQLTKLMFSWYGLGPHVQWEEANHIPKFQGWGANLLGGV